MWMWSSNTFTLRHSPIASHNMLTARLPLAELASVRRALRRQATALAPCWEQQHGHHACVAVRSASTSDAAALDDEELTQPPQPRRQAASSGRGKGFGAPAPRSGGSNQKQPKRDKVFEEEFEEGQQATGPGPARPEYQLYTDDQYMPKRVVGNVQAATVEGKGRVLVASARTEPGDLVMLLPALAFVKGEMFSTPEPEDLHVAMLEDGLTAPQRRVLSLLDDGNGVHPEATLTTLDAKFWGTRGLNDPSAPTIDSKRLLNIVTNSCCIDSQQDTAAAQVRQQAPVGFVGLWPEFALMPHSCVPNTALVVVGDRMLVHATDLLKQGDLITRNCIGTVVTQPLAARQTAVMEAKGYKCNCPRCTTEEAASESMRQTLDEAYAWFTDEAVPQWNTCQENQDMEALKVLYQEAETIVNEVEEAIQAEEGLNEDQQLWLRTAAYDCYDMLVMCDEFLNQNKSSVGYLRACLELIRVFAPGSESHTLVAVKYDQTTRSRAEVAEYYAAQELKASQKSNASGRRKGRMGPLSKSSISPTAAAAARQAKQLRATAEEASELYLEAFCTRYGLIGHRQLELLREGLEMYTEGLEQMSMMKAEGKTEMSTDYMIDGVKFTITDKLGSVTEGVEAIEDEGADEIEHRDGVKVMYMKESAEADVQDAGDPLDMSDWASGLDGDDDDDGRDSAAVQVKGKQQVPPRSGGLAGAARRKQSRKMRGDS